MRKAWLIDGKLSALGGVTGSKMSSTGFVWLALSSAAMKYPIQIVKTARAQLDEIISAARLKLDADAIKRLNDASA